MRVILLNVLIILPILLTAQIKYDYNWVFGDGSQGPDDLNSNFVINFDDGELSFHPDSSVINTQGAASTQSSRSGDLLYHTNNCNIYNRNFDIMEGGEDLYVGYLSKLGYCQEPYNLGNPILSSTISLPVDDHDSIFYLFHQSMGFHNLGYGEAYLYTDKMMYSKIDMRMNEGLGSVVEKNEVVIDDTMYSRSLNAVRHADNESWWILTPHRYDGSFFTLLLTADSILGPYIQQTELEYPEFGHRVIGQSCFSPDGTKFALVDGYSQLQYFTFDRQTGQVSFVQNVMPLPQDSLRTMGVSFSPSSRYVYICGSTQLYQIDTEAEDMESSAVLVGQFDANFEEVLPARFWAMRLGPDCRIYITSPNSTVYLHVIDQPDAHGEACNFAQRGLHLPFQQIISIPNHPHYRLGTDEDICDPNIVVPLVYYTSVYDYENSDAFRFSPNPARDHILLEHSEGFAVGTTWQLMDINGRVLRTEALGAGGHHEQLDLSGLRSGLYIQAVRVAGQLIWRSKVVKVE